MKSLISQLTIGTLLAPIIAILSTGTALAAGTKFSIAPQSTTITQGSNFTLSVTADAGSDAVNAVQVCLTTSGTKLSLIRTVYFNTPLGYTTGNAPSTDCPAGEIQLGRYDTKAALGSFGVAKLTFKALESGVAVVSFDDAKSFIGSAAPSGSGSASLTIKTIPAAEPSEAPRTPITAAATQANSADNAAKPTANRRLIVILGLALVAAATAAYVLNRYVGMPKRISGKSKYDKEEALSK